ncbi:hypothetical protein L198_06950 [Cryptococcus wingfieldii CBS 7118]|uniref:Dol-P-Glc:Glc(2)Man(9)GlcNAc(2)-PP-Dol alpha-1,2-glucosyltransferase n=1 Tax=Cryptococcus wingfieldii CBS 7118 TaxID=1295528 RepID=A0A1E3IJ39_9TREE|nr:hypothetical protein L198_06950 [Cryptococcus wingfieldii CBS 7118]ODN87721.1 hypothetical protein L198_06950 [Cryptococcus wingfieldii CBS 7118]
MSTVRIHSVVDLLFNNGIANPFVQFAVNYSKIYPRRLYPIFIAVQLGTFALVRYQHSEIYHSELHHIDQIQRYANGDWEYHHPDITSPTLWHGMIAAPSYILNITPGLHSLRLFSLIQTLIFPALLTLLTLPPSPSSPHASNSSRFLHALRNPSEYALVISFNPLLVQVHHKVDPGITALLCLVLSWGLLRKKKTWAAGVFGTVVGVLSVPGMIWMVFLAGYRVWETRRDFTGIVRKSALSWLFAICVWALAWTLPSIPFIRYDTPGSQKLQKIALLRYIMMPFVDTYFTYLFLNQSPFFFSYLLTTAFSSCFPSSPLSTASWSGITESDKLLVVFVLRLFLFSEQLKEEAIEDDVTSRLTQDENYLSHLDSTPIEGGEDGEGRAARIVARTPWGRPLGEEEVIYTTRCSPFPIAPDGRERTLTVSEEARQRNEATGRVKHAGKIEVGWDLFFIGGLVFMGL